MDKWYSRVVSSMQILIRETFWSVKVLRQVHIGIPKTYPWTKHLQPSFSQLMYIKDCYLHYSFQVALLDYGQVKDLPDELRLGYAKLVLAIADNDPLRASDSYRCYNLPWKFFVVNLYFPFFCFHSKRELARVCYSPITLELEKSVTVLCLGSGVTFASCYAHAQREREAREGRGGGFIVDSICLLTVRLADWSCFC